MKTKNLHIILAIWICAVGWIGFAESFPNRPTAAEMDEVVDLGTHCMRGVNERCWATQYSTNPVSYRVAPFTNNSCWYLNQNLLGTMASKIKALVPYYCDPDTVYDGTTTITMLTVAGVWADLEVGNYVNLFTLTPASGTNAATYGDSPWRISQINLDERYDVIAALVKNSFTDKIILTNQQGKAASPQGANYEDSVTKFEAAQWTDWEYPNEGIFAALDNIDGSWLHNRVRGRHIIQGGYTTNVAIGSLEAYVYLGMAEYFYGSDSVCPGAADTYVRIRVLNAPVPNDFPYVDSVLYGDSTEPLPNPGYDGEWTYGWFLGHTAFSPSPAKVVVIGWNFLYCTDE